MVWNQSVTNFNVGRKSSTALSHISWVLYLSMQYFSIKENTKKASWHIALELYWPVTEWNIKGLVWTALSHIS